MQSAAITFPRVIAIATWERGGSEDHFSAISSSRRDALKEWKRQLSFKATYGSLLRISVEHSETECAKKIVELLGGSMDGTVAYVHTHTH